MPALSRPDLSRETAFQGLAIGIDEAGRGPWAGPVTVAAVWLDPEGYAEIPSYLDDSKKLTADKRNALYSALTSSTHIYSVISVPPAVIDAGNILQVTLQAMHDCAADVADQLCQAGHKMPLHMLVDGSIMPPIPASPFDAGVITGEAVIGGDGLSLSIAAASIIAKHSRDAIMIELDAAYPGYGWATNMGYGTKAHQEGLARLGVTPHHRKSFKPVKRILDQQPS
ncbi:ribonuclease HII [Alphaproteobacteria bacterium]|nr:ribonuclease HII [Alphaproteobacteria bacterium]